MNEIQKIEAGQPTVVIDNTLKIDRKEIIDLMIVEKEEALEKELEQVEEEYNKLQKTNWEYNYLKETYAKDIADYKKKALHCFKILGEDLKNEDILYRSNTHWIMIGFRSKNEDTNNSIWFNRKYSKQEKEDWENKKKEHNMRDNALYTRRNEIREELKNMPKTARRLKAMLTKKALHNSEEGRQILEYFEKVNS